MLALDRFGDFGSDQVVAPVREACGQALGAVVRYLAPSSVLQLVEALGKRARARAPHGLPVARAGILCKQPVWDVRHGGVVGIKYAVAVRSDIAGQLLSLSLPRLMREYAFARRDAMRVRRELRCTAAR